MYSGIDKFEMNSAQIGSDSAFLGVLRNPEVRVQNNLEMNSQWFEIVRPSRFAVFSKWFEADQVHSRNCRNDLGQFGIAREFTIRNINFLEIIRNDSNIFSAISKWFAEVF